MLLGLDGLGQRGYVIVYSATCCSTVTVQVVLFLPWLLNAFSLSAAKTPLETWGLFLGF